MMPERGGRRSRIRWARDSTWAARTGTTPVGYGVVVFVGLAALAASLHLLGLL